MPGPCFQQHHGAPEAPHFISKLPLPQIPLSKLRLLGGSVNIETQALHIFFLQTCPSHLSIICASPPAAPIHGMTFFSPLPLAPLPSQAPLPSLPCPSWGPRANRLLQPIKCHYNLRAASPWDARRAQPVLKGARCFSPLLPGKQQV